MPNQLVIENFIEGQYRKYFQDIPYSKRDQQYAGLYSNVRNAKLKELFSALHAELINLFDLMNGRLPTGADHAYFWADQSRSLIAAIKTIRTLQGELQGTVYGFSVDEYYDKLLANCSSWLSETYGSQIPPNTPAVTLYYLKPIFIMNDDMPFPELHVLGEKAELLGRGGFGEVYLYKHPIVDVNFAVKFFSPMFATEEDRIEGEKRFFREARMLFQLDHPNIVRIYDVGRFDGKPFIKIEYIDGKSLETIRSEHGKFSFKGAAKAIKQILVGLQYAHDQGIIHRDLKPSNIMVKKSPGKWTCKIIDFGISAFMDTEGYTKLTKTGEQVAGGNYIDPLLQENPKLRDVRSDIYSAGAIMYFLLCGHPPVGADVERVLRESNPNLTAQQVEAVFKSLSLDINKRYPSCEAMLSEIEACI